MPNPCYSYPADMPPDGTNKGPARAARRGLREMPYSCYSYPIMCVSYPEDVTPAAGSCRGAAVPPFPAQNARCHLLPLLTESRGRPATRRAPAQEVPCAYESVTDIRLTRLQAPRRTPVRRRH